MGRPVANRPAVMGRPPVFTESRRTHNVNLPDDVWDLIAQTESAIQGGFVNRSAYIERALREQLRRNDVLRDEPAKSGTKTPTKSTER